MSQILLFMADLEGDNKSMKQLSVWIPKEYVTEIEEMAKAGGVRKSDIVRDLIMIGLRKPPSDRYIAVAKTILADHVAKYHKRKKQ
jgi:metal-responsive CopG/Arc/MetJ family transcriptional regulator